MLTLLPIITDNLVALYEAKTAATRAYSDAMEACRAAAKANAPTVDQIALDFAAREALTETCAADRRYDDALTAQAASKVAA